MTGCATYIADESLQLQTGGATGPVDCTAHAASDVIDAATCGKKDPGGRAIRLLTDEPIPDPRSPGLNLRQVADVALEGYGVFLEVFTGSRALTWAQYESKRKAGRPGIIQFQYDALRGTTFDAGRGFLGGHAGAETVHRTYDPLADGRYAGCYKNPGRTVYTRELMKKAAGRLIIASSSSGVIRLGYGKVYAAFGRDVVPDFAVDLDAESFWRYQVENGVIVGRERKTTGGFSATCSVPRGVRWPRHDPSLYTLVRLTSGTRAGWWISAKYSEEVP